MRLHGLVFRAWEHARRGDEGHDGRGEARMMGLAGERQAHLVGRASGLQELRGNSMDFMRIAIISAGYGGLNTEAPLAYLGHHVTFGER